MSRVVDLPGASHLALPSGVTHLDPEEAVFQAMLEGWQRQQQARYLQADTIKPRLSLIRRFAAFTTLYPWQWTPAELEAFVAALQAARSADRPMAHSTLRGYELTIRLFCDFLTDARYGWYVECERRFGQVPAQICHEWKCATRRCLSGWRWKTPSVRRRSGGLKLEAALAGDRR